MRSVGLALAAMSSSGQWFPPRRFSKRFESARRTEIGPLAAFCTSTVAASLSRVRRTGNSAFSGGRLADVFEQGLAHAVPMHTGQRVAGSGAAAASSLARLWPVREWTKDHQRANACKARHGHGVPPRRFDRKQGLGSGSDWRPAPPTGNPPATTSTGKQAGGCRVVEFGPPWARPHGIVPAGELA